MTPNELWRRIVLLVRRDRALRDLEGEMRLHQDLRARALHAEGLPISKAREAARRHFGYPLQVADESRKAWGLMRLGEFLDDLRHALRRVVNRPGFSVATIAVLGLGIGATTAMFSAVDAALLRPLPFARPKQLVTLTDITLPFDFGGGEQHLDGPQMLSIRDIAAMPAVFSQVAAFAAGGMNLSEPDRPVRLNVGVATVNFFATLGIPPLAGRTFTPDEGRPGNGHVAVLSWSLWQTHYGGRPMLGRAIRLNNVSYQVVGIMPRGFAFPRESDLWIPMSIPITLTTMEPYRGLMAPQVLARVADGVSVKTASRQLLAHWEQQLSLPGGTASDRSGFQIALSQLRQHGVLNPLRSDLVGARSTGLLMLLAATGFLLLIACANVMNLLLAQAAERRREIAVREVLGATRSRLVRQLLTESAVLAMASAAVGVAIAPVALKLMQALLPMDLTTVAPTEIDLRVLGFAVALALGTAMGFGLWPALTTSRSEPAEAIKSGGGHGGTASRIGRLRRSLVVAELALTLILLVGAGLMLRSFRDVMGLDRGLSADRVGTLELAIPEGSATGPSARTIPDILERLRATPGISSAGAVNDLPLGGGGGSALVVLPDDVPPPANPDDRTVALYLVASPGYFTTMGIPIVEGRPFRDGDGSDLAIISAALAKKLWPGGSAIGRRFNNGDSASHTIIGVVGDVRQTGLEGERAPQMYFPMGARTPSAVAIVARSRLGSAALLGAMGAAVRQVDPSQAVYHVRMMDDVVAASVAPRRTSTILISLFAALALLLAALGTYAVISFGVTQRTREFGIRIALGATDHDLLGMVTREALLLIGLGIALGTAGAWELTRLVQGLVFEVDVHDARTFLAVPVLLGAIALIAALLPLRRMGRVNPASVMREE